MSISYLLLRSPGLSELKAGAGGRLGKACLFCFDAFTESAYRGTRVCCRKPQCRLAYRAAAKRDAQRGVWQIPTPLEKRKRAMALSDEEEGKLKAELQSTQKQLQDLLAKQKAEPGDKDKEKERNSESPGKMKLDPDVVKEVQELKLKVDGLEQALGKSNKASAFSPLDIFNFGGKK